MAGRWMRGAAAALLLITGLVLATRPVWTGVREQVAQYALLQAISTAPPQAAPPTRVSAAPPAQIPAKPGSLYAELRIPRIGLTAAVLDGATLADYTGLLARGPAHLAGTAAPGAIGNAVVFGHRDIYGSPFGRLYLLRPGDTIQLEAPGGAAYDYRVQSVTAVPPGDLQPIAPVAGRALTLITCTGPSNSERLIVRAVLAAPASTPQQTPA